MKRRRSFALALVLGLLPAPAVAEPTASPALDLNSPSAQLVIAASQLRFAFAGDVAQALQSLSPTEAALLSQRLGLGGPITASAWGYLIGASTQFLRLTADGAESLWWNPMADAGVILRWRRGTNGWRITAAAPYLGEVLRNAPADADPDLIHRYRRTSVATRAAFRAGAERLFVAPPVNASVLDRWYAGTQSLSMAINGIQPVPERLSAGEDLLITGQAQPMELAMRLARMPSETRLMLAPQRRFADATGESIVWASAGAPDSLLILQYPNDPSVIYPRSILAVDLIVHQGEQR